MKLPALLLFCATLAISNAHDAPAPGASEPKRFKIVAAGKDDILRIDTATGKTWRLEPLDGGYKGWVPVPETIKDAVGGGYKRANDAVPTTPQPTNPK